MELTASQADLLKTTRRADTVRACLLDPVASAFRGSGLGVLVALQFFEGADWQKGLLAAVGTFGMLMTPLSVSLTARWRLSVSRAAALIFMAAAPGLVLATVAPSLALFMAGIFLSLPLAAAAIPLITTMWQQNAPPHIRGRHFSRVVFMGGLAAMLSAVAISFWLGDDPGRYRPVTACFAVMMFLAGLVLWRVPSRPLARRKRSEGHHGLSIFKLLWQDRLFGYLCIAQMFIGFANLATIPLRTEFLGSDVRGMGYMAGRVFLIATVVPEIARFVFIPIWGRLFDRINFAVLRLSVSTMFLISLLISFLPTLPCQVAGSLFYGMGMGGAAIAWLLWVTKLAPAEKTADYMAVHTFLTGFRGLVGPQLAFLMLGRLSFVSLGRVGAGMVLVSIVMLLPAIRHFRDRQHV